ncbi:glycosyltransferase family 4 protein [bacterium]|nr:glycosyltransferase family 4 protein [bacterium]
MSKSPRHLLFCVNHPSPHMADLFRALAAREDVELDVLFMAPDDPERDWGADAEGFSHRFAPLGATGTPKVNRSIRKVVGELCRPETTAILTLYTWPTTWMAARTLRAKGVPWFLMAEPPNAMTDQLAAALRAGLFRWVTRHAAGILAIGRRAMIEFEDLRVSRDRLHHVQYVMDTAAFAALPRPERRGPVRFLSVGQLIPRKGHDLLLRAFEQIGGDATLRIVGDGELRTGLEWLARDLGVADRVRIEAPVPFARRHEAFAEADVFVLATRNDGWGMVVAEAMAAGLPVITTPECGAGVELIAPGTGLVAKQDGLARAMVFYAQSPAEAHRQGLHARDHLAAVWTPERGAEMVLEATGVQEKAEE